MFQLSRAARLIVAIAFCLHLLGGCSPQQQARQSLKAGDPVRAARLYEEALEQRPRDPDLLAELDEARAAAGREQARRAEAALEAGDERRALALARGAAAYDPQFRSTEADIRRRLAERHLETARIALAAEDFATARAAADHARDLAHDLPETPSLQHEIDVAEARRLAELAVGLAEGGDEPRARQLVARAGELAGDDSEIAARGTEVDRLLRRKDLDRMLRAAQAQLSSGQLQRAAATLDEVREVDPDDPAVAEMRDAYEQRRAEYEAILATARERREAGAYEEALLEYARARRIGRDDPRLEAERDAVVVDQKVASLQHSARLSLEGGRYEQAAQTLLQALDLRADEETESMLREALTADHRQAVYHALEREDTLQAIRHLEQIVRIQPDDAAATILRQLHVRVADEALQEAGRLATDGELDQAIEVVATAMQQSPDDRLLEWRAALETDRLVQNAVEAEKSGDFFAARSFYLDALATGRRPDVAERLEKIEAREDVQSALRASATSARTRDAELARRDAVIEELRRDLQEREQALRAERARVSDLEAELRRHRSEAERLRARIERLEREAAEPKDG